MVACGDIAKAGYTADYVPTQVGATVDEAGAGGRRDEGG